MIFILGIVLFCLTNVNFATNKYPSCPLLDGEYVTFFPHETNCSQFYKCSNGEAYLYNCSAGLHFNVMLKVCDWPQNAGCNVSTNSTKLPFPTNTTSTTQKPTTGSIIEGPNCPIRDNPYVFLFPHEEDCSQFYKCSNGIAYLHNCSADLHFNPILNICDWPQNAGCNASTNSTKVPFATDTTSITQRPTNDSRTEGVGPNCPIRDNPYVILFPHEEDCSQFYKCSNGIAYLHNCSADLHFNPILNICDWPQNAGCNASTNSTKVPFDIDTTYSTQNPTNGSISEGPNCPIPDNPYETLFPHEEDCSQFYQCSNGIAYLHNCSSNLHFNRILNICDWPQNAGCVNLST